MLQESFSESNDADIKGADDGRVSRAIDDKFGAASSNIDREHVRGPMRKTRTNAEHCSTGLVFSGNDFHRKSGFPPDHRQKLASVAGIADRARCDGDFSIHRIA